MPAAAPARNTTPFRSAEFLVAVALLAVCLAVGGAYWLLASRDSTEPAAGDTPEAAATAQSDRSDEKAALESWKQKLQGDFAALDKDRQLQAQRGELDRRKQEADDAAQRLEQLRAEAAAATKPQPAAPAAPPVQVASAAKPVSAPAPITLPVPAHEAVRTEASVDWSSCTRPQYPYASVESNEEGLVVLSFKVNAGGEVQSSGVSSSSGSVRLDDAALRALQKCRFKPATLDGTAVASTATVKFRWQLGK